MLINNLSLECLLRETQEPCEDLSDSIFCMTEFVEIDDIILIADDGLPKNPSR